VKKGDFYQTILLTGNIKAREAERMVVPLTSSWQVQIKWMVKEGDSVKPGDTVVRFDTSNVAADIENLEMTLQDKQEQKKQKLAEYANQKKELEFKEKQAQIMLQQKELDAAIPKGIISDYQYELNRLELNKSSEALKKAQVEKEVGLAILQSELKKLGIETEEAKLKFENAQKDNESLTLKAKTAGVIIYGRHEWMGRKIQVGDNVQSTWTVASIPNLTSLYVEAWVNETHIHRIKPGQTVDIVPDAYPDKHFYGTIKDVLNNAEKIERRGKAHYFNASIELESRDLTIMKPGMSVKCVVHTAKIPGVLMIPLEMTLFDGRSFLVKPKKKKAIPITPLGFNEFFLALKPGSDENIKEGTILEPATPSKNKE
jgi:multidrug efflux pump subunit AcrA (membrane-fusion protein)